MQHLSLMTKCALSRKGCIVWVNLNVYVFYKILTLPFMQNSGINMTKAEFIRP